jgi:hypothetical protein
MNEYDMVPDEILGEGLCFGCHKDINAPRDGKMHLCEKCAKLDL